MDVLVAQNMRWLSNVGLPNGGGPVLTDGNQGTRVDFYTQASSEYGFELVGDYSAYNGQITGMRVEIDVMTVTSQPSRMYVNVAIDAPRPTGSSQGYCAFEFYLDNLTGSATYSASASGPYYDGTNVGWSGWNDTIAWINDTSAGYNHAYGRLEGVYVTTNSAQVRVSEFRVFLTGPDPEVEPVNLALDGRSRFW